MSTSHDNVLWLRPYDEIETFVPECGLSVLPGRLAALTHPLNEGRTILLPDREIYDPDLCTVASSGIEGFEKGDVVVLAPDHGAYYPHICPDKRELRIVGVVKPWWESVLAKYTRNGIAPAPGWMLVSFGGLEVRRNGGFEIRTSGPPNPRTSTATVLDSCGDNWSEPHKGERVCIAGMRTYTFREAKEDLALVRAPIASKKWLSSLRKQT